MYRPGSSGVFGLTGVRVQTLTTLSKLTITMFDVIRGGEGRW